MAREILKLKKEKIEGLILDLRFNGGGSTAEAIDLAGIFIEEGPLSIFRQRGEKPRLIKDMNRGTIYDGPLLVLVNSLSASAAELIAASLQDYQRAVIVGSPTFGKASGQVILPLRHPQLNAAGATQNPSPDFIKVTTNKLYRITGETHQKTGVIPDITLPNLLDAFPVRETTMPRALAPDKILKKVYYTALPALPLEKLRKLSRERINQQPSFTHIREKVSALPETGEAVALSLEGFLSQENSHPAEANPAPEEVPFKIKAVGFSQATTSSPPPPKAIERRCHTTATEGYSPGRSLPHNPGSNNSTF